MSKHLVLVGMMGSGKTTVGRWLHGETRLPLVDTDALIEERTGMTVSQIFEKEKEPWFRQREKEVVHELIQGPASIISTGGGLFLDGDNRRNLCSNGEVFYLRASAEELAKRTRKASHRPLLHGEDHLSKLRIMLQDRQRYYEDGTHPIDIGGRPVASIGREILALYRKTP